MKLNLTSFYPSSEPSLLASDLDSLKKLAQEFQHSYGQCDFRHADAHTLLQSLRQWETLQQLFMKMHVYTHVLAWDFPNEAEPQELLADTSARLAAMMAPLDFYERQLARIRQARLAELADGPLGGYEPYLQALAGKSSHALSDELEEKLARLSEVETQALQSLRNEIAGGLRVTVERDGKTRTYSGAEIFWTCAFDGDPVIRRTVHEKAMERNAENAKSHAVILDAVVKLNALQVEWRGHVRADAPYNLERGFEPPQVENMLGALSTQCSLFHEYYELKARATGLGKEFGVWDLHAPLESWGCISAADALGTVSQAIHAFDHRLGAVCDQMMASGQVELNEGFSKRSGFTAFPGPAFPGLVYVPFKGNLNDVFVLAHELGHALRGSLSSGLSFLQSQSFGHFSEVPSIFMEHVLFDFLFARTSSPSARRALLARHMESFLFNAAREGLNSLFQVEMHARGKQERLTVPMLCELWEEQFGRIFGQAPRRGVHDGFGWCRNGFYVSAPFLSHVYVFSNLLGSHLFSRYKSSPDRFRHAFLEFLTLGCSRSPQDTMAVLGLDLSSPSLWEEAFTGPRAWMEELRSLTA